MLSCTCPSPFTAGIAERRLDGGVELRVGSPGRIGERVDHLPAGTARRQWLLLQDRHLLHEPEGVVEGERAGCGQRGVPAQRVPDHRGDLVVDDRRLGVEHRDEEDERRGVDRLKVAAGVEAIRPVQVQQRLEADSRPASCSARRTHG